VLFLPAGTLYYYQAWLFLAVLLLPLLFVLSYLMKYNPKLLERRMRFKEKMKSESILIKVSQLFSFIGILIPGLDFRYGWSIVPVWLIILSNILILAGYMLIFWVFRTNTYTSRIIEVEKGQKVADKGPYAIVRHPMYVGVILMYNFMPLALGSYYALVFFIPGIFIILFRIKDEEILLEKQLKGYKEYMKKVRYRLLPGIY
jgi:protein-S-isoprenylcysteine O-methyltransferase Ste14